MPKFDRNLVSERQASLIPGMLLVKSPTAAHLGTVDDTCCYFDTRRRQDLYEMKATYERQPQKNIMKVRRVLAHPSEYITRTTAKATRMSVVS